MQLNLRTLIETARSIHDDNPNLISASSGIVRVTPVLHDVAQKRAIISLRGQIEVKGSGAYPIELARVNNRNGLNHLYSLVMARRNKAIIEFSSTLNTCWSRFCVTKELLHLYVGCPNGTITVEEHLRLAKQSRFVLPTKDNEPMDDETFCLYLAIEVMLPWSSRMTLIDMHSNHAATFLMAKKYMVPCAMIEHYFDCGYGETSFGLNSRH